VVALRQALGYASWNLFGVSYSTRVMMDVAAADPGAVRSVVLDSYLPANVAWYDDADRNLRDTMAGVGAGEAFEAAVARLNRSPARVPTTDPLLGRPFTATMSGDDVATVLAEAMHEADVSAVAPALVGGLAEGHDELLRPLADAVGEGLVSHEFGLYHAVQCQDEVPFNTFATKSRLFTINADKAVCEAWKLPPSVPVNSTTDAPVYVVGGRYDPTTPARTARPAAQALPHGLFESFSGSHAVFLTNACARRRIAVFVDAPDRMWPQGCHDDAQPARLALPGTHVTGAPYQISRAPWLAAPFALFALVSLLQLLIGALRARSLVAFAGLSGAAFTGLTIEAVYRMAGENETALAVGVPVTVSLYTWLVAGSVVLSAAALFYERRRAQIAATVIGAGFLVWWCIWFL
jgi:pimeloyl-ACP methyl ester carboxylesterase